MAAMAEANRLAKEEREKLKREDEEREREEKGKRDKNERKMKRESDGSRVCSGALRCSRCVSVTNERLCTHRGRCCRQTVVSVRLCVRVCLCVCVCQTRHFAQIERRQRQQRWRRRAGGAAHDGLRAPAHRSALARCRGGAGRWLYVCCALFCSQCV